MSLLETLKSLIAGSSRVEAAPAAAPAPSVPVNGLLVDRSRQLRVLEPSAEVDARIAVNNHLLRHARSVTSQEGEDGVIEEIFRRLGIEKGWCVEFGAWDGVMHSNVRTLIHERGWRAVFIEADEYAYPLLLENYAGLPDVHCFREWVNTEGPSSLDSILARSPIPHDFDLLVIDIDGNDWFIWQSLQKYRPKVVMIEINPFLQADIDFVRWNDETFKGSASLAAVTRLGREKGYELACVVGGNAVLVLRELFPVFEVPDNRPASMFRAKLETKIFQGYDGTLLLAGYRNLIWRHQLREDGTMDHVAVQDEDIQVLPAGLRVFRPKLSYRNDFVESHRGTLDAARVPGNVLLAHRRNVTSECGEDGILRYVFQALGVTAGYCVEVGAHDGRTLSNTWSLLNEQGWRGLLIEKDAEAAKALAARYAGNQSVTTVQAEAASAGEGSLDRLLAQAAAPRDLDLLCIDVEGNDYHLWRSLAAFRPKVVVVDFNPTVSNDVVFVQQDDAAVHHGASLGALVELGRAKGYDLAAVTEWNAIFVDSALLPKLGLERREVDEMYYPVFEMRIFQSIDGTLSTVGCDRLVWHNYVFEPERLQPLPPGIRVLPFTDGRLGQIKSTFFARNVTQSAQQ